MHQHAAMEKNLSLAVESLSMTAPTSKMSCNEDRGQHLIFRSASFSSATSEREKSNEAWMKCFWEKEMGRFSRPRPLSRQSITSDEEYAHYKALSLMIVPGEKSLATALKRFPLPNSVVGDNKLLSLPLSSCETRKPAALPASVVGGSSKLRQFSSLDYGYTERDSEQRTGPPHNLAPETLSPVSVVRYL